MARHISEDQSQATRCSISNEGRPPTRRQQHGAPTHPGDYWRRPGRPNNCSTHFLVTTTCCIIIPLTTLLRCSVSPRDLRNNWMLDFAIMQDGNYRGDDEERRAWQELGTLFPHYETMWKNVIVTLTERPRNKSLRSDLSEEWIRFAESHYSIFLHLAPACDRAKVSSTKSSRLKTCSHTWERCDLVNNLLFTADWILQGVEPQLTVDSTSPRPGSRRVGSTQRGVRYSESQGTATAISRHLLQ